MKRRRIKGLFVFPSITRESAFDSAALDFRDRAILVGGVKKNFNAKLQRVLRALVLFIVALARLEATLRLRLKPIQHSVIYLFWSLLRGETFKIQVRVSFSRQLALRNGYCV